MKLEKAKSWHYQLQGLVKPEVDDDLVVVDIDYDGDIGALKSRPSGIPRAVLAYLSIGEAEDYRAYWSALNERKAGKPVLIAENPDWKGNWAVRFWDEGWQRIILDRAKEARDKGFTGLYLDKADVYADIQEHYTDHAVEGMRDKMGEFIKRICTEVPELDVVLQNAPELLTNPSVFSLIDGCGVEDLVYGEEETGRRNTMHSTQWRSDALKTTGLPVFVVEYLPDEEARVQQARRVVHALGWPLTIEAADRALDGKPVVKFPKP